MGYSLNIGGLPCTAATISKASIIFMNLTADRTRAGCTRLTAGSPISDAPVIPFPTAMRSPGATLATGSGRTFSKRAEAIDIAGINLRVAYKRHLEIWVLQTFVRRV